MRRRIIIYFSFIGTRYQGMQRGGTNKTESNTVQGVLECALSTIIGKDTNITVSSRTDSGVHALESTAQADIDGLDDVKRFIYSPERLCQHLNSTLDDRLTDIRVKRVVEVEPDFHARHSASSRTYSYRIAVAKLGEHFGNIYSVNKTTAILSISDLYRCWVVPQPFDVQAVSKACELFLGTWNFHSFMMSSKETNVFDIDHPKFTKTLTRISFHKLNREEVNNFDPVSNKLDFYDFNIESTGFLRRQVRRMTGLLVSIGQGKLSPDVIVKLLTNPETEWDHNCTALPPDGLFLKSVNYERVPITRGPFS